MKIISILLFLGLFTWFIPLPGKRAAVCDNRGSLASNALPGCYLHRILGGSGGSGDSEAMASLRQLSYEEQDAKVLSLAASQPSVELVVEMHRLIDVYIKDGRLGRAEPLMKKALELAETLEAKPGELTAQSLMLQAQILRKQGRMDDATRLNKQAAQIRSGG